MEVSKPEGDKAGTEAEVRTQDFGARLQLSGVFCTYFMENPLFLALSFLGSMCWLKLNSSNCFLFLPRLTSLPPPLTHTHTHCLGHCEVKADHH